MTTSTTPSSPARVPSLNMAWQDVDSSFKGFCLGRDRSHRANVMALMEKATNILALIEGASENAAVVQALMP